MRQIEITEFFIGIASLSPTRHTRHWLRKILLICALVYNILHFIPQFFVLIFYFYPTNKHYNYVSCITCRSSTLSAIVQNTNIFITVNYNILMDSGNFLSYKGLNKLSVIFTKQCIFNFCNNGIGLVSHNSVPIIYRWIVVISHSLNKFKSGIRIRILSLNIILQIFPMNVRYNFKNKWFCFFNTNSSNFKLQLENFRFLVCLSRMEIS